MQVCVCVHVSVQVLCVHVKQVLCECALQVLWGGGGGGGEFNSISSVHSCYWPTLVVEVAGNDVALIREACNTGS